ncbi:MAG: DUF262 domain-containing protein [Bacteroidales bacterium]|nr:DUF262 domain-containing protein [Bacteroidales bacterium]
MEENKIELKSVGELLGMSFNIPNYQRGYRWREQQVKDLLDDIWEFHNKKKSDQEFYCLQPLVVKRKEIDEQDFLKQIKEKGNIKEIKEIVNSIKYPWDVIDGQQRLTTIFIILSVLNEKEKYTLEYETRSGSQNFLNNINKINKEESNDNIDFFHIYQAKDVAKKWLNENKKAIKDTLLNKVKFIWYETIEEDPIKVFTRLNIGKIPLTNSELIKALLLNSSNFKSENPNHLRLKQQEIASEWDNIEYTLQNDEFWLFLHSPNYDKPTRIDFIFDLIVKKDSLGLKNYKDIIGTDNYRTFRYFNLFLSGKSGEKITQCWSEVKKYFQTFQEWFNDLEMYHYVGFLIDQEKKLKEIYDKWEGNKQEFIKYLKDEIKKKINSENKTIDEILDITYDVIFDKNQKPIPKTKCKPILLFHNIYTVIKQNSKLENDEKYGLKVFYKFPFHLYKKEKWDVEHINSNTENNLEDEKDQREWLEYSLLAPEISDLKNEIDKFLNDKTDKKQFSDLLEEINKKIGGENKEQWDETTKNRIWNFVLLDAGTNRGYGNAIFPTKRHTIIKKESGKKLNKDGTFEDGAIAFVPPVTKNVFLKYYTENIDSLTMWTEQDAKDYMKNIKEALNDLFDIKEQENN